MGDAVLDTPVALATPTDMEMTMKNATTKKTVETVEEFTSAPTVPPSSGERLSSKDAGAPAAEPRILKGAGPYPITVTNAVDCVHEHLECLREATEFLYFEAKFSAERENPKLLEHFGMAVEATRSVGAYALEAMGKLREPAAPAPAAAPEKVDTATSVTTSNEVSAARNAIYEFVSNFAFARSMLGVICEAIPNHDDAAELQNALFGAAQRIDSLVEKLEHDMYAAKKVTK